jgi:hypothetical protein
MDKRLQCQLLRRVWDAIWERIHGGWRHARLLDNIQARHTGWTLHAVLHAWKEERFYHSAVTSTMLRAVQRMQGSSLRAAWDRFCARVALHKRLRVLATWIGGATVREYWTAWAELARANLRNRARLARSAARRRWRALDVAFSEWCDAHAGARRATDVLARAVRRMMGGVLARAWETWAARTRASRSLHLL